MDTSTVPPGTGGSPVIVNSQQARGGSHGNVGPVIGVLAVIGVLGIIAGLIGRLCSGRTIMGYGPDIDVEAWLQSKCSSCLDGHVTNVNANPRFPHPHLINAMETFPTTAATAALRPPLHASMPPHLHLHPHPRPPQQVRLANNNGTTSHCDSDSDISADQVQQHHHQHQQKLRLKQQADVIDESSDLSEELNHHLHHHQQQQQRHHPD